MGAAAVKSRKGLDQLLQVLDEKSRAMLWHLWWHRHAGISELRELIDAANDFDVLYRLREVINEQSLRLWGRTVVSFEQSKMDSCSGTTVLFNWWFQDEENFPVSDKNKPLMDIFYEKESISIMAQVPTSIDYSQPEVLYKNGILKIQLGKRKNHETGEGKKKEGK
jgi:HSP20 family molecular chaperone IbpA